MQVPQFLSSPKVYGAGGAPALPTRAASAVPETPALVVSPPPVVMSTIDVANVLGGVWAGVVHAVKTMTPYIKAALQAMGANAKALMASLRA